MYEVSCRDLGVADCEFDVMAHSLERLERAVLTHARYCTSGRLRGAGRGPRLTRAPRPQGADRRGRARGRRRLSAAGRVFIASSRTLHVAFSRVAYKVRMAYEDEEMR